MTTIITILGFIFAVAGIITCFRIRNMSHQIRKKLNDEFNDKGTI